MTQSHQGRRNPIAAICFLLVVLLAVSGQTLAAPGLEILDSGPHYSGATYRETVRDLRVKLLGGHADLTREWRDGRWWFHPYWADLRFDYNCNNSDGQPDAITRYDLVYQRIAGPAVPTYAYRERLTISRTAAGWRWANRDGDWIDYDADGHCLAFGTRNATRITLRRNLGSFIDGVLDANGQAVLSLELDEIGRPQRVVDHSGRAVHYSWNGDDLASVRDVRAQRWRYDYATLNATRLLAGRTDPRGYRTAFTHQVSPGGRQCLAGDGLRWVYDDASDTWVRQVDRCTRWVTTAASLSLREISDAAGVRYRYAYFYDATKKHYSLSRRDGEGALRERRVDLDGELIEERLNGRLIRATRKDGRHRIIVNERGLETRIERDQWDNPVKITHPDGSRVTMAYDPHHNGLIRRTDERGVITEHQYDDDGNRIRTIEAKDRPEQRITRYSYDANGLLLSRTREAPGDAKGATTTYGYDTFGNLTSVTDPAGGVLHLSGHDAAGNPRTLIDARGMIRRLTYDAAGNRLSATTPLGHTEHTTWDAAGNRASHTDALGHTTRFIHDARNVRITTVHPDDSQSTRGYNGRDQLLTWTDEAGHLQLRLDYDAEGNLAAYTDGAGNRTGFDHGINADSPFPGLLNRIDYPTFSEIDGYDLRGRRTLEQRILDADTEYSRRVDYDLTGNLITEWDENESPTHYSYDGLGQLTGHTDTAAQHTTFGYDTRGNLTEVTNARSIVIRRYDYDNNDRQIAEILPDGSRIESNYDATGNLIEQTGKNRDRPRFPDTLPAFMATDAPAMPRRARIVAAGYPMHVILRGIDRSAVFFADDDCHFFLDGLRAASSEESVAVHACVLMTNHVHLLMTADRDKGVPALMKRLGQRYVQHVNRIYHRAGGLFEGRFRSSLIMGNRGQFQWEIEVSSNIRTSLLSFTLWPDHYDWNTQALSIT